MESTNSIFFTDLQFECDNVQNYFNEAIASPQPEILGNIKKNDVMVNAIAHEVIEKFRLFDDEESSDGVIISEEHWRL